MFIINQLMTYFSILSSSVKSFSTGKFGFMITVNLLMRSISYNL